MYAIISTILFCISSWQGSYLLSTIVHNNGNRHCFLKDMGILIRTSLLLLAIFTTTNALVLPRANNSTLPDSGCLNTNGGSCESNWDRIPTALKAVIFIVAFIAFGGIVYVLQRVKNFVKELMPSWLRSTKRRQDAPPTQRELIDCWQAYGARDPNGRPAAATQEELVDLWRSRNDNVRFVALAEGPRMPEAAPFIVHGVGTIDPGSRISPGYGDGHHG
jgi:hypothetical protein